MKANPQSSLVKCSRRVSRTWLAMLILLALPACSKDSEQSEKAEPVRVYCSVDEPFGRAVMEVFRRQHDAEVEVIFDTEAGKTTGLVNRIIAESEAGRPRADVFWSSEIFNTIRLADMGMLKPYEPPTAKDIPGEYRDPEHHWTGLAVRARVVAFDPDRISKEAVPKSWKAYAQPEWAARTAIANPLFGTTRGHVAAMFALWGEEESRGFLTAMREGGCRVADGNSTAVRDVIAGTVDLAFTDTDDVWVAQRAGHKLDLVYPDMGDGGTLLIPCTVALVAGRPESENAKKVADFLVSAEVERMLAQSDSRNIPVRESLRKELNLTFPPATKVSYDKVTAAMEDAMTATREILLR